MKRWFCWLLAVPMLILACPVNSFTISPMKLTLPSSGATKTIKVKNTSDQAIEMSSRIFSWANSSDLSALEKTNDLIVVPPLFVIPPNSEQTVRVALRKPLELDRENAYRLLLGEVSSEVQQQQAVGVNLTVNLPIFVRPDGANAAPDWTIEGRGTEGLELVLENAGSSYLKLKEVSISSEGDKAAQIIRAAGGYVLAGDKRSWPLDRNFSALNGPFVVKADSNIGPIEAVIALPDS